MLNDLALPEEIESYKRNCGIQNELYKTLQEGMDAELKIIREHLAVDAATKNNAMSPFPFMLFICFHCCATGGTKEQNKCLGKARLLRQKERMKKELLKFWGKEKDNIQNNPLNPEDQVYANLPPKFNRAGHLGQAYCGDSLKEHAMCRTCRTIRGYWELYDHTEVSAILNPPCQCAEFLSQGVCREFSSPVWRVTGGTPEKKLYEHLQEFKNSLEDSGHSFSTQK